MLDYLLCYPTEADALAALPAYARGGAWDASRVIPGVSVYRVAGTEMVPDGAGGTYEREVRAPLSGWYLVIACQNREPGLEGEACMLIADRNAASRGEPFVRHAITTAEDLATLRLEPVFAGSTYPFGAPTPA